jgi:NAD(P)-dependent dehydrogenase (short-subunit alcohol dehydrogenase family)
VTGAASGIGRACASAFLAGGAAVVDPGVEDVRTGASYLGVPSDVPDAAGVDEPLELAVPASSSR